MTVSVPPIITERRDFSQRRLERFRHELSTLAAPEILGDSGFVYATGSLARGDASAHSDLDLFVVSFDDERQAPPHPMLSDLRTIQLQAALIRAAEQQKLPPFSDDGRFLKRHSISEMVRELGTELDDYENLFTARILLLLESQPILGNAQYERAIDIVLDEYWRDAAGREEKFLPLYLTNDIIRYWKVLCLNYEARTRSGPDSKRRATNYKLKYSRLLTCYSALLYFCALLKANGHDHITREETRRMIGRSPLARLEDVAALCPTDSVDRMTRDLLDGYAAFLQVTDCAKDDLRTRLEDETYRREHFREARKFGDTVFELLREIGTGTRLYRYLVV